MLIAGAIWWFAKPSPFVTLLLFFVLMLVSSVTIGFLVPAWYDMIAKVIPVELRGRYSALVMPLALLSMGCAYWAGTVLDRVSYPNNFALLFLAAYGVTFLSWIALALTREPPSVTTKQHIPFARFISELPTILRRPQLRSLSAQPHHHSTGHVGEWLLLSTASSALASMASLSAI